MDGPTQGELTAREVAVALGVSERTVLSYVERGLLTSRVERRGLMRRHYFTREDVAAFREQLQQGAREE